MQGSKCGLDSNLTEQTHAATFIRGSGIATNEAPSVGPTEPPPTRNLAAVENTDTDVAAGARYLYRVKAIRKDGVAPRSRRLVITTSGQGVRSSSADCAAKGAICTEEGRNCQIGWNSPFRGSNG